VKQRYELICEKMFKLVKNFNNLLTMNEIAVIIIVLLTGGVVLATAYYLLKLFFDNERTKRTWEYKTMKVVNYSESLSSGFSSVGMNCGSGLSSSVINSASGFSPRLTIFPTVIRIMVISITIVITSSFKNGILDT